MRVINAVMMSFESKRFSQLACWLVVALNVLVLAACGKESVRATPLPAGAVVLVVGDSLVAGTGAPAGSDWPRALGETAGWNVVNAGVPGDTAAAALTRLPALLDAHRPDAVIIAVGGNDFLRNVSANATRESLEQLLNRSLEATSHVALLGVPSVSLARAVVGGLADDSLFSEIARERDVLLISGAIAEVLSSADLRSDRIHANARGYEVLAQRVFDALAEAGWVRW